METDYAQDLGFPPPLHHFCCIGKKVLSAARKKFDLTAFLILSL